MNLEELANARRLRVTAVIPPQYNPISRLKPPLQSLVVSFFCQLPPLPPSPSRPRPVVARFNARFYRSLSFLRLFTNAPRPITSGTPHPRRYASALFFPRVPPHPSRSLIFRFYFLSRRPSSFRACLILRPPLLFSTTLLFPTPHHGNK